MDHARAVRELSSVISSTTESAQMAKKKQTSREPRTKVTAKRSRLSQTDVPGVTLQQALRVPLAIAEEYAGKPTSPLRVASALKMQPNAGPFRTLCGAAIAYGLTSGGPNAEEISLTPLGLRIVRPLEEGKDEVSKREALLQPRVIGEFLRKYDGHPVPRQDIALNVLVDIGVPRERAEEVMTMILEGAKGVGYIHEIKGRPYVDLRGVGQMPQAAHKGTNGGIGESADEDDEDSGDVDNIVVRMDAPASPSLLAPGPTGNRRVFVTHGKNKDFLAPIKKLLGFGEMEPVVSVEKQSVSQPVPDKVMSDMRSCGAAIIHVDAEQRLVDVNADEHLVLNPNVLIEIGAAMALYGRRFILLVRDGVKLPSNLQGLYEVRYSGDALSGDVTIRLLEAINDIKNHAAPDRYSVAEK